MLFLALVAAGALAALLRANAWRWRMAGATATFSALLVCFVELPVPALPGGHELVELPALQDPVYRWLAERPDPVGVLELPDWSQDAEADLAGAQKSEVIVPPKALATLRTYAEGEKEVRVSIGENSVSFDMTGTTIYSRLLEGPFPNYQRVIPAKNEKELVVSRSALSEAVKRVSILADTLTRQVVFSIAKNKLTLNVSTQELGEAREELDAAFSAEPMDVGYNAAYVLDILRTIEAEEILFLLDRPDTAALVKPASDAGNVKQLCIVMPLRIT